MGEVSRAGRGALALRGAFSSRCRRRGRSVLKRRPLLEMSQAEELRRLRRVPRKSESPQVSKTEGLS